MKKSKRNLIGCQGGPCTTALGDAECKTCKRKAVDVINWNTYTDEQKIKILDEIQERASGK